MAITTYDELKASIANGKMSAAYWADKAKW